MYQKRQIIKQLILPLLSASLITGCATDVVVTEKLRSIEHKRIYIGRIECDHSGVADVLRDCLLKEFVKAKLDISEENSATMIITGSVFMTPKSDLSGTAWTGYAHISGEEKIIIDSVSLQVKAKNGEVLAIGSFNNSAGFNAVWIGEQLGQDLAGKLK